MPISRRADMLKVIAERLSQPSLRDVLKEPTVSEALRITILYQSSASPNSVATLRRGHGENCRLHLLYEKAPAPATFEFSIPLDHYKALLVALRRAKFDTLDDAEVTSLTHDLWLIERAAGSFYHDVVLSPQEMRGHHREIVLALRENLPEALRVGF